MINGDAIQNLSGLLNLIEADRKSLNLNDFFFLIGLNLND